METWLIERVLQKEIFQNLVPDHFLKLVNIPKQPIQVRNSFVSMMF